MDQPEEPPPLGDETRAFQAFYLGKDDPPARRSWWRALLERFRRA